MRLFVALLPPADAIAELADAIAPHRRDWQTLRWVEPERWHVTLAFLGQVPDTALPDLDARLTSVAADNPALRLSLNSSGTFPAQNLSTVLWTGLDGCRVQLIALAGSVNAAARRAGAVETDPKPMHPHLTVARARPAADLAALRAALAGFHGKLWSANEIHLVCSAARGVVRLPDGVHPPAVPTAQRATALGTAG